MPTAQARQSSKELHAGLRLGSAADTPRCAVSWRGDRSLSGYVFPQITTYERTLPSPTLSAEQLCADSTYYSLLLSNFRMLSADSLLPPLQLHCLAQPQWEKQRTNNTEKGYSKLFKMREKNQNKPHKKQSPQQPERPAVS